MSDNGNSSFIHPDRFWRDLGLQAGEKVVHLGSGAGFYIIPAAKIVGSTGSAIGVDVMEGLLSESEGRAQREEVSSIVHTIRANVEVEKGSTLPDDSTNWVLVGNILHQSDPIKVLNEAKRIVKPNGHVVVVEWDVVSTPLGPPQEHRLSKEDIAQAAASVGLNKEKEFSPSPYHYGILFTKKA